VTTIRLRPNGPLVVEGDDTLQVVDWDGQPYEIVRRPVALCRCGASGKKPFCDGAHARTGFRHGPGEPPRASTETP